MINAGSILLLFANACTSWNQPNTHRPLRFSSLAPPHDNFLRQGPEKYPRAHVVGNATSNNERSRSLPSHDFHRAATPSYPPGAELSPSDQPADLHAPTTLPTSAFTPTAHNQAASPHPHHQHHTRQKLHPSGCDQGHRLLAGRPSAVVVHQRRSADKSTANDNRTTTPPSNRPWELHGNSNTPNGLVATAQIDNPAASTHWEPGICRALAGVYGEPLSAGWRTRIGVSRSSGSLRRTAVVRFAVAW
jgi:hypothetical protein